MACKHKSKVWDNGWCNVACRYCTFTQESTCQHNHQTNADRIRAMSDEELAEYLVYHNPYHTESNCLKWLQQPAEEG